MGKTKYVVANDCHLFSKYELKGIREKFLNLEFGYRVYGIGDNIDIQCCHLDDVDWVEQKLIAFYKKWYHWVIPGNHDWLKNWMEIMSWVSKNTNYPVYENHTQALDCGYIEDTTDEGVKVGFRHGHIESNAERYIKHQQSDYGAGFFKRNVIMRFIETFEFLRPISKQFLKNAAAFAKKMGWKVYVCGHKHPSKELRFVEDGILIIVLPQGINTVLI